MLTVTQLEALRPELAAWNLRQERVRDEYDAHPIAACMGVRRVGGEGVPCDLMAIKEQLCRTCERERVAAAKRMRNVRVRDA